MAFCAPSSPSSSIKMNAKGASYSPVVANVGCPGGESRSATPEVNHNHVRCGKDGGGEDSDLSHNKNTMDSNNNTDQLPVGSLLPRFCNWI